MSPAAARRRFSTTYFFLFAIYGVSSPYLQVLLRGLGYGEAKVGLLLGIFELAGIAGPVAVARLADRAGRYRPALFLSGLVIALALPPLVLFRSFPATALFLAILSVGLKSLVPVMDAAAVGFAARQAGEAGRRSSYGGLRALGTLGFIAMIFLLQWARVDRGSPRDIALWMGAASLAFLGILGLLPEAPPEAAPSAALEAGGRIEANGPRTKHAAAILPLGLLIIALGRVAMAPIASFFTLYATEGLHTSAAGYLWILSAGAEVPFLVFSSAIIRRLGPMRSIALSNIAIAARLLVYALFPSLGGAILGQLLHALCYGLFHPAAIAFTAQNMPPERRTEGLALYMGLGVGLPSFLGSALGGFVLERSGYRILFASFSLAAFAALALYGLSRRRFGEELPTRTRSAP